MARHGRQPDPLLLRGLALASAAALLAGCAAPAVCAPKAERNEKVGYNRREMPPEQGLFTGSNGVWALYLDDADPTR